MQLSLIIVFVFAAALVNAALSEDLRAAIKRSHEKCQSDSSLHIEDTVFRQMITGNAEQDSKFRRHSLCMNVELGIQNQNGDINVEKLKKYVQLQTNDQDKTDKIIDKCVKRDLESPEEAAVALNKCLMGNRPHH